MKLYMFLLSLLHTVRGYKPVILIHGVLSKAANLEDLKKLIQEAHPGTEVSLVHLYPEAESFVPLTRQLKYWREKVDPLIENAPEGVHLICHSQGGLICQGLVEYCDDHHVNTLITLSSPVNGQFGVPDFVSGYLPWLKGSRETLSKYMYTRFAQDTFAISNYWRDPRLDYHSEYLSDNQFLPVLQNNPEVPTYDKLAAAQRKKNFLKLKKLVLIGGPDDGVITPWQSSVFGYYDENFEIVDMKNQTVFQQDLFGLRTLYERGDISTYVIPGVNHVEWHGNKKVFETAIKPWLN